MSDLSPLRVVALSFLTVLISLWGVADVKGQDYGKIRGKIVDSESGEALIGN